MPMLERLEKPLVYYADEKLEDSSDGENGLGISCGNGENKGTGDSGRDGGKWGKDGWATEDYGADDEDESEGEDNCLGIGCDTSSGEGDDAGSDSRQDKDKWGRDGRATNEDYKFTMQTTSRMVRGRV